MRILVGKNVVETDGEALTRLVDDHDRVVIDVGTGDGRFVLRGAQEHPKTLYVGFDPVADNMIPTAQKARKKPAKGGVQNALFVVSSLEQLPDDLNGLADEVHVGYPWGSLLAAFVEPRSEWLARIYKLAKPGAPVHVRLNQSVFDDEPYMGRLGLPTFDRERLLTALRELGTVENVELVAGGTEHSSWERKLVAGSNRKTLVIAARTKPERS